MIPNIYTLNMYSSRRLKAKLLIKAYQSMAGKVTVKRLHHPKDGSQPYWETHHVLPDKVESGDVVLANHHLLPSNHPQYKAAPQQQPLPPTPQKSHGNTVPDEVKAKIVAWEQKNFTDRSSFLAALKKMGVTWNESDKPGMNYMRARMALNKLVMEKRFDPDNPTDKILPAPLPVTTSPAQVSAPQSVATNSPTKKPKLTVAAKAAAHNFFQTDCGGDKSTFYQKLKQLGVKWKEVANEGINFMFAKAALGFRIDEGFDPRNPNAAVKPSTPPLVATKTDESMLDVPAGATEREKNLVELINKITSIEDIQGYTRMGMVPEDERARQFILDKLQLKLAEAVVNPDDDEWLREKDKYGHTQFPVDLREGVKSEWGDQLLQKLVDQHRSTNTTPYSRTPEGFSKALVDQLEPYGCKKHAVAPGLELLARFNMNQIMNPRDYITGIPIDSRRANLDVRVWDIVKSLNEAYTDYTTDDYQPAYSTNLGYTGMDESIYVQRYDVNKEGFVRGLRKIAKDNPPLQSKTEEIISTYDEMMKTVGYNPHVLNTIMESSNWSTKPPDYYKVNQFGKKPCQSRGEAIQRVKDADRLSDMVIGELTKRGYSQNSILTALSDTTLNDGLNSFRVKNDSGTFDVIDFSKMTGSDGKPLVYMTKDVYWGSQLLHYTRAKYQQSQGLGMDDTSSGAMLHYNAAKRLSEISEDDYKKVHQLSMKLAGFKLVHTSGNDLDYSLVNAAYDNWQTYSSDQEIEDESPEMDAIMANLKMHKMYHDINTEIVKNMSRNAASNFNNQGKDYSGNFDYYSGTVMSQLTSDTPRVTQVNNDPNGGATYTTAQLSAKINQQMDQVPGVPLEYLDKLKTYYSKDGHHPKADAFSRNWGSDPGAYLDSPIKDIMYQVSQNVLSHMPATASKPSFQKVTAKRLNYVPFDFSRSDRINQPRLYKPKPKNITPPDPKELKAAREKLLAAAKCSIATEPEDVCEKMRQKFAGEDFDYKRGEKTPDGETMLGPIHSIPNKPAVSYSGSTFNQVPLFNSPFFRINNSIQSENFQKRQDELKSESPKLPSECYSPLELFQGTSYWSTASIFGRTAGFFMGNEAKKAGKMLGFGPYFAAKVGKTSPYIGNLGYALRPGNKVSSQAADKDKCDGICIMASIMRGNHYSTLGKIDAQKKNLTSLSMDANAYYDQNKMGIRDFEIAVKDNDLINPHHIVDVSMRTIGFNIRKCPEGYRDMVTGRLLYDSKGVSLDMRNNE